MMIQSFPPFVEPDWKTISVVAGEQMKSAHLIRELLCWMMSKDFIHYTDSTTLIPFISGQHQGYSPTTWIRGEKMGRSFLWR